ncbi:MAG: HlyD family efflux transporter periplasmic adaptor subunit [Actinomycetota bacterium]
MSTPDPRLATLSGLLQLQSEARRAEGLDGFAFVAVNQARRLLDYRLAVLWLPGDGVHAVSGVPAPDPNAPMVRWLDAAARALAGQPAAAVAASALPAELAGDWAEWLPASSLWLPLPHPDGGSPPGALWMFRDQPFSEPEVALAVHLAEPLGESLARRRMARPSLRSLLPVVDRRRALRIAAAALLVATFPVRLSVLAPAEISARDPAIVAAPRDGVVRRFLAEPNRMVEAGQPLIAMDDTEAAAKAEVSLRALAVAEAEYRKAAQASFGDRDSAGDLAVLQARIDKAAAEAAHAEGLLARSKVEAPRPGLFVASDPSDWAGRPVRTGERIGTVADPARVELVVWLPVADVLVARAGAEVEMFLNTAPLSPLAATLRTVSFEAGASPEGVPSYRLVADLAEAKVPPRIGLKGTAKVHGETVPLLAWVLRRPLAAARQMVGL